MSDAQALLAATWATGDLTPLLALADMLDEQDDPGTAELLRLTIANGQTAKHNITRHRRLQQLHDDARDRLHNLAWPDLAIQTGAAMSFSRRTDAAHPDREHILVRADRHTIHCFRSELDGQDEVICTQHGNELLRCQLTPDHKVIVLRRSRRYTAAAFTVMDDFFPISRDPADRKAAELEQLRLFESALAPAQCPLPHSHRTFGVAFAEFASEAALSFARRIRQTLPSDCDGNSRCAASRLHSHHHHRTPLFTPRHRLHYARCLPRSDEGTIVGERRFYRSDQEWIGIVEQLKQTRCPHCHACGTLNRHGVLYGFDDTNDSNTQQRTLRARRILCSKRRQSPKGCGRTFSIWLAHKIRRFSLSTHTLLTFLQHAVAGSISRAAQAVHYPRSERTFQRIWKRFDRAQSRIRTALLGRGPPPESSAAFTRRPEAAQVLAHLQASFPNTDCPITAFQLAIQCFFI